MVAGAAGASIPGVRSLGRVGRYELLEILGEGGMATVYLAHQDDLDRQVALKELMVGDARRFLREARLAGSLSHPNIVTVHDYFEHHGRPYIAMEYMPRGSLRPFVGRLSLAQVGGALSGVLAGLAHAAARGIVHRDLKPENLMVDGEGAIKIADFGIARATGAAVTANLTTTGTTLGTPRYMSPERALGQELGPWSDLYSVGVIAFELLVGRTPFHDTDEPMAVLLKQINDPVPPVVSLVPDAGRDLSDWVERLLEKDPELRTGSAAAALDELDEILADRLGPRWRRDAPLPARPGARTRTVTTVRAPRTGAARTARRGAGAGAARAARRDAGAGAAGAARRDAADWAAGEDAAGAAWRDREGDAGAGAAAAARRDAADWPPAGAAALPLGAADRTLAPKRARRSRLPRLAALAAVLAVAAFGADRVLERRPAAVRPADLTSARSPSERERTASALADRYEQTASELQPGAQRVAAERVADAYRRAADAVQREDGSDYDDALADARKGERALTRAQRGVGDSQSDDPSDDEPDEDEP